MLMFYNKEKLHLRNQSRDYIIATGLNLIELILGYKEFIMNVILVIIKILITLLSPTKAGDKD